MVRTIEAASTSGNESARRERRKKLELTWIIGVVLFTLARFAAAWGALAEQPRWVVYTFGVIDLATAVPYAMGTARLVTSLVDRNVHAASRWGAVAAGSFLAPYLWIAWAGRDGSLPTVVYVAVALCVVCFGTNAAMSVRRKVAQGRRSTADDVGLAATSPTSR